MLPSSVSTTGLVLAGGFGIVAAALYLLRRKMSRKWIDLSRYPELKNKRLDGQVVIITGANTGLGRCAAEDIAKRAPHTLVLACRDVVAGSQAAKDIMQSTGHPRVRCMHLDLASIDSVNSFAENVKVCH